MVFIFRKISFARANFLDTAATVIMYKTNHSLYLGYIIFETDEAK